MRLNHLVEGNNEGGFPLPEDGQRLERLGLKTMHNIHYQNGYVTHRRTPHTQVAGGRGGREGEKRGGGG